MTVHVKRHIAKTITYRIIGTLTTVVVSYIFTNNIMISSSIGFIELILKPLIYFIHERVWYKYIRYGIKQSKSRVL
jgi:uncharacterized membrane protein